MYIRRTVNITTGVAIGRVTLEVALNETEQRLIREFGPPIIELGGTIPQQSGSFSLDAANAMFPDHFPVSKDFGPATTAANITKARDWTLEVEARIVAAMTALAAKVRTGVTDSTTSYTL